MINCDKIFSTEDIDKMQSVEIDTNIKTAFNKVHFDYLDPKDPKTKFIFVKLYYCEYRKDQMLSSANIAKGMQSFLDVFLKHKSHHVAINTTLKDNFVGMTAITGSGLFEESITRPENNPFYKVMDFEKSKQTILAVPMTAQERSNAVSIIQQAISDKDVEYKMITNLTIPVTHILGGGRLSGAVKNPYSQEDQNTKAKKQPKGVVLDEKEFVCSTFAMYVIDKSSKRYSSFLKRRNRFTRGTTTTPSDMYDLPGAINLGTCACTEKAWKSFVQNVVKKHPRMKEYV